MADLKMIVGLGNPGKEYFNTRHNIGFEVVDSLASELAVKVSRRKFGGRFGAGEYLDKKLILLKPWQYMNCSGNAVATATGFYRLSLSDLLVVSDDMALPPGTIRLRPKGSAGGHNGLADIIEKLGSEEFNRLRVGIGRSDTEDDISYVLGRPSRQERKLLDEAIEHAKAAVFYWADKGIDAAMNEFNAVRELGF